MRKRHPVLNSVVGLGIVSYSVLKRGLSKLDNKLRSKRTDDANRTYNQDSKEQPEKAAPQFDDGRGYVLPAASETELSRNHPNVERVRRQRNWLAYQTIVQAALTLATLAVLVYHGVIFTRQQSTMQGQLDAMLRQSNVMQKQWDTMQEQASIMNDQATMTGESLKETRNIVQQNERAVKAAETQARASQQAIVTTAQSMMIQERAYVLVKTLAVVGLNAGGTPQVTLTFINAGNTPAVHLRVITGMTLSDSELTGPMTFSSETDPILPTFGYKTVEPSYSVVGPKIEFNSIHTYSNALNQQTMNLILQQKLRLYVWGRVTYDDIFMQSHETAFCYGQYFGTLAFAPCNVNNDTY